MSASSFLESLFTNKPEDAHLLVWTKSTSTNKKHSEWFDNAKRASEYAELQSDQSDVYFGIALASRAGSCNERVKIKDAAGIPCLWCEVDYGSDGHKAKSYPPDEAAALALIELMPCVPTYIIHSGNGFHCYWFFKEVWLFADDDERESAKTLVYRWQKLLESHASAHGWHVDATHDLARVYRVPNTLNHKNGSTKPVNVFRRSARARYSREELASMLASVTSDTSDTVKRSAKKRETAEVGNLVLDASAEPPRERFDALCKTNALFRQSHERKRKDFKDTSASSYDMSLATVAAAEGWSDQEIVDLLIASRRKHGDDLKLRQDYYARTVARARTPSSNSSAKSFARADAETTAKATASASSDEPETVIEECNDDGNARRFVRQHGDDVRYCAGWRSWLIYDGKRWQTDKTLEVERRAKRTARSIVREAEHANDEKKFDALLKHAQRTKQAKGVKDMLTMARSDVPVASDTLDADKWLLNCANGTIDLRTGELREHRRDDYITKLVNVEYDASAQCPTFVKFLHRIMDGNESLIAFLRRAVGYSLTGDVSERVMFILFGGGKNGKTVFCEAISALLADYAKTTPASTLMSKRDATATNDVAALKGSRFVFANETDENKRLDEAGIKNITGGDTVSARFLYSEYFNFKPEFKIWLRTNHKPVVRGTDEGIWDRLKLIPFAVRIPKSEQDNHLSEKLRNELSGILAWAVEGCLEWQRDGLGVPEEVENATARYRKEQDNFANFISECCVVVDSAWTATATLRTAYEDWCKERGERPSVTGNAFAERLQTLDCHMKSARQAGSVVRGWQGIGLV